MPLYTRRNNELVRMMEADFQPRYDVALHWANACSCVQALPGLRGFWPFGAMDSSGNAIDQSGHGHTLTYTAIEQAAPLYNYSMLRPYTQLSGGYFSRTDEADLDITGTGTTEPYVTVSRRGIALGGWFYATALPTAGNYVALLSKWHSGVSQSYQLVLRDTGVVQGIIEDGAGNQDSATSTATVTVDEWFFAAFTWSGTGSATTESVWVSDLDQPDGLERTDAVPVRANIRNSTANFCAGSQHGGTRLFAGYLSMCWLSAMCLTGIVGTDVTDALVFSVFQQQRALFGV